MSQLPAMPTCAAIRQSLPIRTLCPTCTRLSSLVRSPIRVSSSAPRSIVQFAPISTSAPITQPPTCGTLYAPSGPGTYPKPSVPMRAPACTRTRSPSSTPWRMETAWPSRQSTPRRAPRPMSVPGPTHVPRPIRAPCSTTTPGPSDTASSIRAPSSIRADGWIPGGGAGSGWKSRTILAKERWGSSTFRTLNRTPRGSKLRGVNTAPARVPWTASRIAARAKNARSPGPATSSEATPLNRRSGSPSTSAPTRRARSETVYAGIRGTGPDSPRH